MNNPKKIFDRLNSTITIFKWFLIFLIFTLVYVELSTLPLCSNPFSPKCLGNFFSSLSNLTRSLIPLLAALLATLVADRHLLHSSMAQENERVYEIIQITHRYIAITNDLESKVAFLKNSMPKGGFSLTGYIFVSESIEKRYESYFEKDAYKHLPGEAVNIINSMSGSITGLVSVFARVKASNIDLGATLPPIAQPPADSLLKELSDLKDILYELRKSIDNS